MAMNISSEVAGIVTEIFVSPGKRVSAGDVLVTIESMKMEFPVNARAAGTVLEILVDQRDAVSEGQKLLVLQPD